MQLLTDRITLDIDPERGGRVAQLWFDGVPVLVGAADVPTSMLGPGGEIPATAWGSYPMVPWAGRVRRGRFLFDGNEHRLPINMGEHAIHGTGFTDLWSAEATTSNAARLSVDLPADHRWPFGGRAVQTFTIDDTGVEMVMEVTAGTRGFPVSFGWHPWFRKPERIRFEPTRMYRRDADGIAVDELIEVPAGPWDDCFVNTHPIEVTISGIDLRLTSDCTRWVVYDQPDHATCIEPQTGPPNAFTIEPRILLPGCSFSAWYRIDPA